MLKKFRGTNEAEPRKQCESLARARVAFSMFLATLIHSNMHLHRVYTNEFWVFTASTYCGIGGARCNPSPWEDKIGEKPVLLYIGFV